MYESSCYFVNMVYIDWLSSTNSCSNILPDSHLVVITSEPERQFIIELARYSISDTLLPYTYLWIGAQDYFGTEGVFEWITGERWDWDDSVWVPNEPSDMSGNADAGNEPIPEEDCLALNPLVEGDNNAGKFLDLSCFHTLPGVCEFEL